MATQSRSIYRGYTDNGIGLGDGIPIAYGEQYLQGTDASLTSPSFLRPLVPWLTLSVQASEKQLEAWSCFSQGDSVVIARLVPAEDYNNRDAYFSHARVWEGHIPFDAAIYLGQSECFDNTQKDIGTASCLSPKDIIESWVNLLNNDSKKDIAINVIAHLYQALAKGYPLLIAARIDEFKAGSELFKYIAFARCALPATIKQPCNIRLFTRDLVANQDSAQLILIPDDYTYQALQKLPNAALLNSQGKQQADRRGKWQLEERFENYASDIVGFFCDDPHGLLPYSNFLQRERIKQMLKEATDSEWVYPCYVVAGNLVHNFTQETANNLFCQMRHPDYSDYPWFKLLPAFTEDEWKKFPKKTLFDFVLENPDDLSEADKNLQSMLITSWQNLSLTFDDIFLADLDKYSKGIGRILALSSEKLLTEKAVSTIIIKVLINYYGDNNSENRRLQIIEENNYISQGKFLDEYFIGPNLNDTNLRKRLLQLLSTKPELLNNKVQIANDTSEIRLSTWIGSEIPSKEIITLLENEYNHNTLFKRYDQTHEIIELAKNHSKFFLNASLSGELSREWLEQFLNSNPGQLEGITKYCFDFVSKHSGTIGKFIIDIFPILYPLLFDNKKRLSPDCITGVKALALSAEIQKDPLLYFKLANLLPEPNQQNELIKNLFSFDQNNKTLVSYAFDEAYPCITPIGLINNHKFNVPLDIFTAKLLELPIESITHHLNGLLSSLDKDTLVDLYNKIKSHKNSVDINRGIFFPHISNNWFKQGSLLKDIDCLIEKEIFDDWWQNKDISISLLTADIHDGILLSVIALVAPLIAQIDRDEFYKEVTKRWDNNGNNCKEITKELIKYDIWYYWWRAENNNLNNKKLAAMEWLTCPIWNEADRPDPTREAWIEAMDACGHLTADDIKSLGNQHNREIKPKWPIIRHFELEQLKELYRLTDNLSDKADLAELIQGSDNEFKGDNKKLLEESDYYLINYLMTNLIDFFKKPLNLEDAKRLLESGSRQNIAKTNIISYIFAQKKFDLNLAKQLTLMQDEDFVDRLEEWMDANPEESSEFENIYKAYNDSDRVPDSIIISLLKNKQFSDSHLDERDKLHKIENEQELLKKYNNCVNKPVDDDKGFEKSILTKLTSKEWPNPCDFLEYKESQQPCFIKLADSIHHYSTGFFEQYNLDDIKPDILKTCLVDKVLDAATQKPSLVVIYNKSRLPFYEFYAQSARSLTKWSPAELTIKFIQALVGNKSRATEVENQWRDLCVNDEWWKALFFSLRKIIIKVSNDNNKYNDAVENVCNYFECQDEYKNVYHKLKNYRPEQNPE